MDVTLEKSIYIKTLLWAYSKQHAGFSKEEMRNFLNLENSEEWEWIDWMFTNGLNGEAPLIWSMPGIYYGKKFYLTSSGVAAAVDYLELKNAQDGSRRAERIAITSIVIGIIVGVVQIIVQISSR